MKLKLLRQVCPDNKTCPAVYMSDRQTLVLRGYVVREVGSENESELSVELPLSLLPEVTSRALERISMSSQGTVIVTGPQMTDVEALGALDLPDDEQVIELPLSWLAGRAVETS